MPHITLKSIANNAEIDDIWEKWQAVLEPLRAELNAALRQDLGGMGNPARADAELAGRGRRSRTPRWWEARIARQKEIDASIAARADVEYLYDKPYADKPASASPGRSRSRACRRIACCPRARRN